jgi:hypothetical protein
MWNTDKAFVESIWPDAEDIDPAVYTLIMNAAHELCASYAPFQSVSVPISDSWKLAEILQARDIWNQMSAGNRQEIDASGFVLQVTRLNYLAQDLIRPKTNPWSRIR